MCIKSSPCIWWGSNLWGHFMRGNTATIFSVRALMRIIQQTINEKWEIGEREGRDKGRRKGRKRGRETSKERGWSYSYIFCPIVEFSWNNKSTSTSNAHIWIHHVIPPTIWSINHTIKELVNLVHYNYLVKRGKTLDTGSKIASC